MVRACACRFSSATGQRREDDVRHLAHPTSRSPRRQRRGDLNPDLFPAFLLAFRGQSSLDFSLPSTRVSSLKKHSLLTLALVALHSSAQTFTTYNSFGPGYAYNVSAGWLVDGTQNPPQPYVGEAFAFTAGVSGYLSQLDLVLGALRDPGLDLANVSLALNRSGKLPSTVLESFLNVPSGGWAGLNHPTTSLTSSANPFLQAGVTYWLCVEPSNPYAVITVNQNSLGLLARQAQETSPGAWFATANRTTFAFDVQVLVPEPSTAALAALGLSLVLRQRARR